MLQRIRDGLHGQKWLAWVIVGAIGLTFVFWGGSGALDFSGMTQAEAAKVNGEEIPATEAVRAWSQTQNQWAQQFGTDIPAEQRERMQENILDSLVLRSLVEQRLENQHYGVSEAAVFEEVRNFPAFQDQEGKYNAQLAREMLRQSSRSEQEFFRDTRSQLMMNQLQQGIGGSFFLTRAEQQRLFNLENEEREVEYALLPAESFAGTEPIDDAAIQAYYENNADRFMIPESVALDYAELRFEQLAAEVTPTEEDLRRLYEESRASFVLEERRRARHILVPVNDDEAAALAKAEAALAEARAGADFAELAKKYSTDITANQGGDLGFVEKQQFVGPFGDALFAMKVGDITGPVKSQFGYHIIKLEEIQAAEARPFEDVRAELDSQYRQEQAAELFSTREEEIVAALEGGATDLDALATELGMTRGSVPQFLRGGGGAPLGSSQDLQQTVFGDATLNQGRIGGPVPLGDDRLVLVKVAEHRKADVKPLEVVREEIVALLRQERGVAAARAAAEGAVPKLEAGAKLETLAREWDAQTEPARFVSRGDPSIPAALRTAIFEAPRPAEKPVIRAVPLDDESVAVFVVTRSRVGASDNPQLEQQQNAMLVQRAAAGDVAAYVNEMKRKAEIIKNPAVFE